MAPLRLMEKPKPGPLLRENRASDEVLLGVNYLTPSFFWILATRVERALIFLIRELINSVSDEISVDEVTVADAVKATPCAAVTK